MSIHKNSTALKSVVSIITVISVISTLKPVFKTAVRYCLLLCTKYPVLLAPKMIVVLLPQKNIKSLTIYSLVKRIQIISSSI